MQSMGVRVHECHNYYCRLAIYSSLPYGTFLMAVYDKLGESVANDNERDNDDDNSEWDVMIWERDWVFWY